MKNFYALDLETESLVPGHPEYGLQPWRVRTGEAAVTVLGVGPPELLYTGTKLSELLGSSGGGGAPFLAHDAFVWTWNGIFDIGFLIASGVDCSRAHWLDAMSATKWLCRSQRTDPPKGSKHSRFSWSLANAAETFLRNWEHYDEFIALKKEVVYGAHIGNSGSTRSDACSTGSAEEVAYWRRRCVLDVAATLELGRLFWSTLTPKQLTGFLVEQDALYPAADSWVRGKLYDFANAGVLEQDLETERAGILTDLIAGGLIDPDPRVAAKVLGSTPKCAELLYDQWGVPLDAMHCYTPKGKRSVGKEALTFLIEKCGSAFPGLSLVQRYRGMKSKFDKFLTAPRKAREYLQSDYMHHQLRINSTYTGRCTVSSKCARRHSIGIAFHQWPRLGKYRRFLQAPPGYCMVAADVDSQETKLMADFSKDQELLEVYRAGLNPHAITAAKISGAGYHEIIEGKEHDETIKEVYTSGKVTNLAGNYRMGTRTLWRNAHVDWGMTPTLEEADHWRSTWLRLYRGVTQQWEVFIYMAKKTGYAETLGGRRFYIDQWGAYKWSSESSAIMVPIQGSGADIKYLGIATVRRFIPYLLFWDELHDALIYLAPAEKDPVAACKELKLTLDNLDYGQVWGWTPTVQFTWSVSYGPNFGDLQEVEL